MTIQIKRPEKKFQDVKVSEQDIVLFSLGIDPVDFILPSERKSYLSDKRAVQLLEDIKAGKSVTHQDYSGINLKGADISGVDFTGCNFSKACFYQTNAQKCQFEGACFDDAYIEETDLTDAVFRDVSLKRVFLRNNNVDETFFDEASQKYFADFDKFLSLVESGKIDIRSLTQNELSRVDIRRLDLTKVNLAGIDLSRFAMDGVNLAGTYIDPKQLLSLGSLQKRYFDLRRTKEKKKKQMEEALLKEKEEELRLFYKKAAKIDSPTLIAPKKPTKKEVQADRYLAWPNIDADENGRTPLQENTQPVVEPIVVHKASTDEEGDNIIPLEEQRQETEFGVKKVTTKQRELQQTKTKVKG